MYLKMNNGLKDETGKCLNVKHKMIFLFKNFHLFSLKQLNCRIFSDVLKGVTIQQGTLTEGGG